MEPQLQSEHYLNTEFLEAANNNDIEKVKDLLDRGVDVNTASPDSRTALHRASCVGHAEVEILLSRREIDVNKKTTNRGRTALMLAVYWQHLEVVKMLLGRKEIDIAAVDKHGQSALFDAAQNENNGRVLAHLLLCRAEQGAARVNLVNAKDHRSKSPLYKACVYPNWDVLRVLGRAEGAIVSECAVHSVKYADASVVVGVYILSLFVHDRKSDSEKQNKKYQSLPHGRRGRRGVWLRRRRRVRVLPQ